MHPFQWEAKKTETHWNNFWERDKCFKSKQQKTLVGDYLTPGQESANSRRSAGTYAQDN